MDNEISDYLETADLIVLLVSADFLASYYCYEREMARALERAEQGEARLAPIILRACDWKATPFAQYVLTPTDAKPIVEHPDIDAAFLQVVNELRRAISKVEDKPSLPHRKAATSLRKIGLARLDHPIFEFVRSFPTPTLPDFWTKPSISSSGFSKIPSQNSNEEIQVSKES